MHHKLANKALDSDEYELDDLKKMVEIALLCTQSPPSSRPTMSEILVMILSDRSAGQMAPKGPSLRVGNRSVSNATVSISHYTGR